MTVKLLIGKVIQRPGTFYNDSSDTYRGVKAVDKRDGGGAHNWGSHRDDIE